MNNRAERVEEALGELRLDTVGSAAHPASSARTSSSASP